MADNTLLNLGSGGDTIASEDIGSVKYQRVKLVSGTATSTALIGGDATNGLDVDVTRSVLPTGAATLTEQETQTGYLSTLQGTVDTIGTAFPSVGVCIAGTDGTLSRGLKTDTNGELQVDVLTLPALAAGTAYVGKVRLTDATTDTVVDTAGSLAVTNRPIQKRIQVTPTISTSAYTTGDVCGGLMTFANAARVSGGSGVIQSITVLSKANVAAAMDLIFFDRSVTVAADNAAIATSDTDMEYCLGLVTCGPYNTVFPGTPLNHISTLPNIGLPFVLNGTSLFAVAIIRATATYVATSDLVFTITVLQD